MNWWNVKTGARNARILQRSKVLWVVAAFHSYHITAGTLKMKRKSSIHVRWMIGCRWSAVLVSTFPQSADMIRWAIGSV
jgi:hypothetical protein